MLHLVEAWDGLDHVRQDNRLHYGMLVSSVPGFATNGRS